MKAHIGVDADSGLVHAVIASAANVSDVTQAQARLHGDEEEAFGDAGYQGADKRGQAKEKVSWHIAIRPGKRRTLELSSRKIVNSALISSEGSLIQHVFKPFEFLFNTIQICNIYIV